MSRIHTNRKTMRRREHPFHFRYLTFSNYHGLPLFANPAIRDRFARRLEEARLKHRFELFAWIVMPEHVHLLLRPQPDTLVSALASFKTAVAKEVLKRWRELDAPILCRLRSSDGSTHF